MKVVPNQQIVSRPSWAGKWKRANGLVQSLVSEIERLEQIPATALLGPSKRRELAEARWAVMLVAHRKGCSLPSIAKNLGRGDHTTVLHGVRKGEELRANDPGFAALVGCLERAA